jgi:hypothetical protein
MPRAQRQQLVQGQIVWCPRPGLVLRFQALHHEEGYYFARLSTLSSSQIVRSERIEDVIGLMLQGQPAMTGTEASLDHYDPIVEPRISRRRRSPNPRGQVRRQPTEFNPLRWLTSAIMAPQIREEERISRESQDPEARSYATQVNAYLLQSAGASLNIRTSPFRREEILEPPSRPRPEVARPIRPVVELEDVEGD